MGGGALPDIVSLLTPQQPRVVEVTDYFLCLSKSCPPTFPFQVEVPHHDLVTAQIMQMFDIKGGAKVRMGFNIARIVRSLIVIQCLRADIYRSQARIENAELRSAYREGVGPVTATPNRFTLPLVPYIIRVICYLVLMLVCAQLPRHQLDVQRGLALLHNRPRRN